MNEMTDEEIAAAFDRRESWMFAKAWLGALMCDDLADLAEYLTASELWEEAGGDVSGLRAALPGWDVLDRLQPVIVEPVALDAEAVALRAGDCWVTVGLRLDGDAAAWRVEYVRTEITA